MKKFTKSIVKEFWKDFGRFLAIMAIIALGVGFLVGLMQTTPDMKNTMADYYRENKIYDINIKGTYGLTENDINLIRRQQNDAGEIISDEVMPFIQTDVTVNVKDNSIVARINGVAFNEIYGEELNRLTLEEGAFPSKPNECVAERSNRYFESISVGDTIVISDPDDGTYGDIYKEKAFTVVGIVSDPAYYYIDGREISQKGNGTVGTVLYVPREAYSLSYENERDKTGYLTGGTEIFGNITFFDILQRIANVKIAYTDCYLTVNDAKKNQVFDENYADCLQQNAEFFQTLAQSEDSSVSEINRRLESFSPSLQISPASWYILDLASANVSYIAFAMNADKVSDIAGIFPVFFIVVAALVALTSMTRMVEEERSEIGTLKALGYAKGKIMSKYLLYCIIASIIGCTVGVLCGFALLPSVIWAAYGSLYYLPQLSLGFSPVLAITLFAAAIALTVAVTVYACYSSLKEKPSALMQPKAPKAGKRILLERVGILWNPLPFRYKATVRNIFRYKKNMFMTVLSIIGCTALIFAGFSLNNSIAVVSDVQYTELIRYDAKIAYDLAADTSSLNEFLGSEGVNHIDLYTESGALIFTEENKTSRESVDLYIFDTDINTAEQLNEFIVMRDRKTGEITDLAKEGVVLSENLAIYYGVKSGDFIGYRGADGTEKTLEITGVFENYTESRAYMSYAMYAALYGELPTANTALVIADLSSVNTDELTKTLLSDAGVTSVSFTVNSSDAYGGLSRTMGYVIAVLVISAGALAAIVLYNLTNINIDERRREIATLKVLGYTRREIAGYIYRESMILTLTGDLLGLLLGFFLHGFIIRRIDSVALMMGRVISAWSYLYAFGLTLLFAGLIYAFMLIKLNRINMADSLKSNE